jgi:hypothetical protein
MHQPFTTEVTTTGLRAARNSMRERLWADHRFAHRWLCHPEHECKDGCDESPNAARWALYASELE